MTSALSLPKCISKLFDTLRLTNSMLGRFLFDFERKNTPPPRGVSLWLQNLDLQLGNIVIYVIFHKLIDNVKRHGKGTEAQVGILPAHLRNMAGDLVVASPVKGH